MLDLLGELEQSRRQSSDKEGLAEDLKKFAELRDEIESYGKWTCRTFEELLVSRGPTLEELFSS